MDKNNISDNTVMLEAKISELNRELDIVENAEEIEKVSRLIKKNVPFFRRSYFASYLLLELLKKQDIKGQRISSQQDRNQFREKRQSDAFLKKDNKKKEFIVPEGAKTLYLNIGKMKHLYGKDLSKLLQKELGITREDIYVLRVHDKYTFITMSEENCQKAIERLNGKEINGRLAEFSFSNR